jgi:hypothetical protein
MSRKIGVNANQGRIAAIRAVGALLVATLSLLGSHGCGDPNTVASLKVHPVTGKVLLADGTPLKSGQVVLVSDERGMEFSGTIGPDGTFAIKTNYGDGAPEGKYSVRIDPEVSSTPASKGRSSRRGAANLPYPAQYADESTSGLTVTVKPGENALEPFKLTPGQPGSTREGSPARRG